MLIEKFKNEYIKFNLSGCFIDPNCNFVLIHIFKNASISIRNALNMRGNYREWNKIKDMAGIKKICIIRDPVKRFVSAYLYILRLHDGGGFLDRHPVHITRNTNFYKQKNNTIDSFKLFLQYIENNGYYDAVLVPQVHFLKARNLKIQDIDYLFVLENLEKDYSRFCKDNSLKNNLKKDNKSPEKATSDLLKFIEDNNQIKKRIINLYQEDVELYNDITLRIGK